MHEYRLSVDSQQWIDAAQSFNSMDERQRDAICALVQSTPGLWRTRQMSPDEVWNTGKKRTGGRPGLRTANAHGR